MMRIKIEVDFDRIITFISIYDEKDNLIYHKVSNGFEKWYEYDENGNEISYKSLRIHHNI